MNDSESSLLLGLEGSKTGAVERNPSDPVK